MLSTTRRADAAAVRRTLKGNPEAFGPLIRRYRDTVYAVCFAHTRNHADADDLTQEALLKAFTRLDTIQDGRKFGPWLMTIARNLALKSVTRSKECFPLDTDRIPAPDTAAILERAMETERLHEVVLAELDRLTPEQREVLSLHYFAKKDTAEIARLLDISRDAVKKRLQRSREALGAQLVVSLQSEAERGRISEERLATLVRTVIAAPAAWLAIGSKGAAAATGAGFTLSAAHLFGGALLGAATLLLGTTIWLSAPYAANGTLLTPRPNSVAPMVRDSPGSVVASAAQPTASDATGAVAAVAKEGMWVSGRVVDAETEAPIPSFAVYPVVYPMDLRLDTPKVIPEQMQAISDEDGRFSVALESPGYVVLVVEARGYERRVLSQMLVEQDQQVVGAVVPMTPVEAVRVRAIDFDGRGVEGAEVEQYIRVSDLKKSISYFVGKTDGQGYAGPLYVNPDYSLIRVHHADYRLGDDYRDGTDMIFTLFQGGTIKGRVTQNGIGVPRVSIYTTLGKIGASAITQDDGSYELQNVWPGLQSVVFRGRSTSGTEAPIDGGFIMWNGPEELRREAYVETEKTTRLDVELTGEALIEGRVTIKGSLLSDPAHVTVAMSGSDGAFKSELFTGPDGTYRVALQGSGTATIVFTGRDHQERPVSARRTVELEPGYTTTVDVDLGGGGRVMGTLLNFPPMHPRETRKQDKILILPVESGFTTLESLQGVTYEQIEQAAFGHTWMEQPPAYETPLVPPGDYVVLAIWVPAGGMPDLAMWLRDGLVAMEPVTIIEGQDLPLDLTLRKFGE